MRRRWIVAALLVACVALNLLGRVLVDVLTLPLYLDMTGTAIAAVGLGPWWGALVGVATNLAGSASSGAASIPFALVNVVGALIWGYGVRSLGWGRSIARFFALNVVVALACTLVAAPIIVFAFGGEVSGHGAAAVTETILAASHSLVVAAFSANLLTSLADKLIAGFVALVALDALPQQVTGWSPGHLPSPERLTDRVGPLSARSRGAAPQSRS